MFASAGFPDLDKAQNKKQFMIVYPWQGEYILYSVSWYLSPYDGWNLRVSRSSTGDDQLSPRLLAVLAPGPHVEVRGVLGSHDDIQHTNLQGKSDSSQYDPFN